MGTLNRGRQFIALALVVPWLGSPSPTSAAGQGPAADSHREAPSSQFAAPTLPTGRGSLNGTERPGSDATPRTPYDLSPWQAILSTYVTSDGGFRYRALRANGDHRALLERFVQTIGEANPGRWPRAEQLAFFINAYNALTVDSVLDLWPVRSVMAEEGFFNQRRHRVAGQMMTLDHLENQIIRPRFREPRIHFLVNCASVGCPPLQAQAFTAANLEGQLAAATRRFVRRSTRVDRTGRTVELSKLFEWFAADFQRSGGVRRFVGAQLPAADRQVVESEQTRLRYRQYDWSLNGR